MQTSNPTSVPFPYCLSESLARAYLRAQEANAGTPPNAREILAAFAQGHVASPDAAAADAASDGGGVADPAAICGLLDRAELLAVMREPIAWVFTLAERSARGDAVDLTAIARVRDAVLHRVDAIIAGAVASEPPRIRAADLLTVSSLLVGTLDPALVRAALQTIGASLVDALGALSALAPSIDDPADDEPSACGGACAQPPGAPHACGIPRVPPFADPYAGKFGGPHLPRPPALAWAWALVGFPM